MKEENKKLIRNLLEKSASLEEDIFADSERMLGCVPFILKTFQEFGGLAINESSKDESICHPKNIPQ